MSDDLDEDELVTPAGPAFPKTVLIAGIIWIVFGSWVFLIAGFLFSIERPGSPTPLSLLGFAFGGASVYVGIQTVRGMARGMWGNALGSIVFALFMFIHAFSVVAALGPQQGPDHLIAGVLDAAGTSFAALGFLAAGILALWGHHDYRSWLQAQKGGSP